MKVTQDTLYAKLLEVSSDIGSLKTNVDSFHDRLTEHAEEDHKMAVRIGVLETDVATIAAGSVTQTKFADQAMKQISELQAAHQRTSGLVKGLTTVGTVVGAGLGAAATYLSGKHG